MNAVDSSPWLPQATRSLAAQGLRLLYTPRLIRRGIALDNAPQWRWLALLALALWPTWWWMGQRMVDGSDDPLGVLALGALAALVWQHRQHLRDAPRLGLQLAALIGAVVTTAVHPLLPDLVVGLIAVLSLAAGLLAFLPAQVASGPVWGLSVLALPLLASLQFYAGFPLRVVTAELSSWLLMTLGHTVTRSGSSLVVDSQLIIVDAPCSGVQMVWLGYFTACAVAVLARRSNHAFVLRLPVVGSLVLLGNVLRNSVLVVLQAAHTPAPLWAHDAIGLLVLATVCGGIAWVMQHEPLAKN